MKRVYILVQGPTDAAFLHRILPQEVLQDTEIISAGGNSGMSSLARSLLVRRKRPVAIVMDSDSLNPKVIEERHQTTEEFVRAADASTPVKVISVVPEIEAWFFATPGILEQLVGQQIPPDWLALGKRDPKAVLRQLAEKNQRKWDTDQAINALKTEDIERIRAIPEVAELNNFLREMREYNQAA